MTPTILPKKIEDLREAGETSPTMRRCLRRIEPPVGFVNRDEDWSPDRFERLGLTATNRPPS